MAVKRGITVCLTMCLTKHAWNSLQGRVVRKPVNANPELKVNHAVQSINFSTAYALCTLSLVKLKTEGQTI